MAPLVLESVHQVIAADNSLLVEIELGDISSAGELDLELGDTQLRLSTCDDGGAGRLMALAVPVCSTEATSKLSKRRHCLSIRAPPLASRSPTADTNHARIAVSSLGRGEVRVWLSM